MFVCVWLCVVCGVWCVVCVVCGVWCVVCGVWCVVCGVWLVHLDCGHVVAALLECQTRAHQHSTRSFVHVARTAPGASQCGAAVGG